MDSQDFDKSDDEMLDSQQDLDDDLELNLMDDILDEDISPKKEESVHDELD